MLGDTCRLYAFLQPKVLGGEIGTAALLPVEGLCCCIQSGEIISMRVATAKHALYETRICDEGVVLVQTATQVLAAGETFSATTQSASVHSRPLGFGGETLALQKAMYRRTDGAAGLYRRRKRRESIQVL